MSTRAKLKIGDVFLVPVEDAKSAVCQIAERDRLDRLFVATFAQLVLPESDEIRGILGTDIVLLGLTMDARLRTGDWRLCGNYRIVQWMPLPAYKLRVGAEATPAVEDFRGTRSRRASSEEFDQLPFRKIVSPMLFELAVRAHFGVGRWREEFDGLTPRPHLASDVLIPER